jgi:hypothetical protein
MQIPVKKSANISFYLNGRQVSCHCLVKGQIDLYFNGRQIKNAYCEWFEDETECIFKSQMHEDELEQAYHDAFLITEGLECEVTYDQ